MKYVQEALKGKSLARILFNDAVSRSSPFVRGRALDLAGGIEPSYLKFLPREIALSRTNRAQSEGVAIVDFNRPLPYESESFDTVLLFNAIYIVEDPLALLREIRRVLRHGGIALVSSPFVANEMPEPRDYGRFTSEGLRRLSREAGFAEAAIERLGDRGSAAIHALDPFLCFRWMRPPAYSLALLLDRSVPRKVRQEHPMPVSYFARLAK